MTRFLSTPARVVLLVPALLIACAGRPPENPKTSSPSEAVPSIVDALTFLVSLEAEFHAVCESTRSDSPRPDTEA